MIFAFDTETRKTSPGCKAPPMACLTWKRDGDSAPSIVHAKDARRVFETALRDPATTFTGHFIAFDMTVCAAAWPDLLPEIFDAYDADRVTCTMLREKLFDIATGKYRGFPDENGVWRKHDYNLDAVARRRIGRALKKDGWRRRYGLFIETPLAQWVARAAEIKKELTELVSCGYKGEDDEDAKDIAAIIAGDPEEVIRYPLEDANSALGVHLAQEDIRRRCNADPFVDEFRQARASFWLNLMTTWGMRTHAEGVDLLRVQTQREIAKLEDELVAGGLVRGDGSKDTKQAKARMLAVCGWEELPREGKKDKPKFKKTRPDASALRKTKSGDVSLDRDACKASGDELLEDYGERAQLKSVLDKDVPMLEAGTLYPVHPRIDIKTSGRTSESGPNLQNLRRLPGIREAFVPRDGWVFAQADFPGLELHTLAQACIDLFGYSKLGEMLNAGIDPHLAFVTKPLGISYEEAKKNKKRKDVDDMRQVGKVFNFGAPGGLGSSPKKDGSDPTLITFARKTYNVVLTIDQLREYKKQWFEMLPEMRDFFAYNARLADNPRQMATVVQLRSKRIRGGCFYTQACNTWFQGLGADAAKHAGWLVTRACYVDRRSPLFGSRPANFVHDELINETRDNDNAHDAAHELARLMKVGANEWLPDVPFKDGEIEPVLMRVWSKDAEALHDARGRLVPWTPALGGLLKMGAALGAMLERVPTLRVAA